MRRLLLIAALALLAPHLAWAAPVKALKITVLSTMLAHEGVGEWGYAALVEVDGRSILFDTGARPQTVLANARELGVDLASVEEVVISHNHLDHTGGLVTLRRELMKSNPAALSRVHVARGFFTPQSGAGPRTGMPAIRTAYGAMGGKFIEHDQAVELAPGVWLTGPVPRRTDEQNYPTTLKIATAAGPAPDTVAEDQALVFETAEGPVVLTGCGHAGVVNLVDHGRDLTGAKSVLAVIGGLHIFAASDEVLAWTGEKLKAAGVRYLLAGHCTGLEATWRLRQALGLSRKTAAYGAVGATFTLGEGIDPKAIAG